MRKKALFIFYYYSKGYAAGIQNERLISGLEYYPFDYEIIYRYSRNTSIQKALQISSPQLEFLNKIINFLIPGVIPIIRLDEILWTLIVILRIRRSPDEYNFIHIASSPFFIQLIGNYFKARKKIKWVVQLLDPVSDNFFINTKPASRYLLSWLEKVVINKSDLVITNNQRLGNKLKYRYQEVIDKLFIIPPVTDKNLRGTSKRNKDITIIHSGGIYGYRTLDYLIKSLRLFNDKYKLSDALEIQLIGNCSEGEREKVKNNQLENQIKFVDYLERAELNMRLAKADAFLVIDALNYEGIFFPTKLCEYFSLNKIIFAITPRESITSDIITESKHLCFSNNEEEKFADALFNLVKDRNCYNQFDKNYFRKYSHDIVALDYLSAIDSLELKIGN